VLKRCSGIATIGFCLVAFVPAEARGRQGPSPRSESHAPEMVVLSGIDRRTRARALDLMPRHDPSGAGLASSVTNGRAESRMLGRLPLHQMVDLGVGLFAVTGASVKERELKRTDPMRDVAPRSSRVAGAGLRVNF
jgi:hypothetical protein